ncbi:MAG: TrgA family protein [Pseudomonadota bacterium]
MPTFARLTSAVLFAALAYYVSTLIPPLFVEERPLPTLANWNALFGLILGWRLSSRRGGVGLSAAIGFGISVSAALFLTALFFHSSTEMITRSMRGQYDGPAQAVVEVANLMYEFGTRIATVEILGTTFIGGIMVAIFVDVIARRYD